MDPEAPPPAPDAAGAPGGAGDPPHHGATLLTDVGFVYLSKDPDSGRTSLCHRLTHESRLLPGSPDVCWDIHFDAGRAWCAGYIDGDFQHTVEAMEVLQKSVYVDDAGHRYALFEQDGALAYERLASHSVEYTGITIHLAFGACAAAAAPIDAAMLLEARQGARVWWNLLALHDALGFRHGVRTAGKWVMDGMDTWQKFMRDVIGLRGHVMKSKPYSNVEDSDVLNEYRFMPFPSVSSIGLVALMVRFCWGPWRLRGAGRVEKCTEAFKALLKPIGAFNLVLYLDAEASMGDDGRWVGQRCIQLPVDGAGMVDLQGFFALQDAHYEHLRLMRFLRPHCADRVSVQDLLSVLAPTLVRPDHLQHIAVQVMWRT